MEIHSEYSLWWMAAILPLAAIASFWLYRRASQFEGVSVISLGLMGLLRFFTLSVLGLFLLKPYIRHIDRNIEKPQLILLQDNSASMIASGDSAYLKNDLYKDIEQFSKDVVDKFEVQSYHFDAFLSGEISSAYDGTQTDLSAAISELQTRFAGRNVGSIVIVSDGNYNKGNNPLYISNRLSAPYYAMAAGDTARIRDMRIDQVLSNSIAFSGNQFPLVVRLRADGYQGSTATIEVSDQNGLVERREVAINADAFARESTFLLSAGKPGVHRYNIRVVPQNDEKITENNFDFHYIEVVESRQKVLLLAGAPHPDIAAIASAIRSNPMYEVHVETSDEFEGEISDYALVIAHQITAQNLPVKFNEALDSDQSIWFITGTASNMAKFNEIQSVVRISNSSGTDAVTPIVDKSFAAFEMDRSLVSFIEKSPPLIAPFGDYSPSNGASVMLRQVVGSVTTDRPLFAFAEISGRKIGVLNGEGLWRWRIQDYAEAESHERFDLWVNKIVQFLSLDLKKERFVVRHENIYDQNVNVRLSAELYNPSYERISGADLRLLLKNDRGEEFPFAFSPIGDRYNLDMGSLAPGEYSFTATAQHGGERFEESGAFTVREILLETKDIRANHNLLASLTAQSGGEMYALREWDKLAEELIARTDLVPVIFEQTRVEELIHFRWIMLLLIGLLAAEWFMRKYNGGY